MLHPLGAHVVQFVYYGSEVVGLVELERAILDAVRVHRLSDDAQAVALGSAAKSARKRQLDAKREAIELPLVEYAYFSDLLVAARRLGLLDLDETTAVALCKVRNRSAHSGEVLLENRQDCNRLAQLLGVAADCAKQVRRGRRQTGRRGA